MNKITATLTVAAALVASNMAMADGLTRAQVKAELAQAWADGSMAYYNNPSLMPDGPVRPVFSYKKRAVEVKAPVVVSEQAEKTSKQ